MTFTLTELSAFCLGSAVFGFACYRILFWFEVYTDQQRQYRSTLTTRLQRERK